MAHEVAQQVSISGVEARRFIQKPIDKKNSSLKWELWRDLCKCTTNDCTQREQSLGFVQEGT